VNKRYFAIALTTILLGVLVASAWAPTPKVQRAIALQPPNTAHLLGTDNLGRDVLHRSILAICYTLRQVLMVLGVSLVVGSVMAAASAMAYRRVLDDAIVFLAESLRAFPTLLLVLLFATVGLPAGMLLTVYFWIPIWRILRSELVAQQRQPYALSAQLLGMSRLHVLLVDVLPNIAPRSMPYITGIMSETIAAQCAIEFLGFGPSIEQPSLGGMLLESSHLGLTAPWVWCPSLVVIVALILAITWTVRRYRQEIRWVPVG